MKNTKLKLIKRLFSKRTYKAKAGATLIELMAVVCILAITSSTCIGGMFAMADVAKRGQDLSFCERTSDMLSKQLSIYGNTASYVQGYSDKPTPATYEAAHTPDGFMDFENSVGDKNDFFLYADPTVDYRLIFAKYDSTTHSYKEMSKIDNVKSISFKVQELEMYPVASPTDKLKKFVLQYNITTVGTNVWDKATDKRVEYTVSSGVVLNNSNNTVTIPALSDDTIETKSPSNPTASTVCLRIRTTSRSGVDIS